MRLLLVLNPSAGGGRAGRLAMGLAAALRGHGFETDLHATRAPGEAARWLAGLRLDKVQGVIAAGGDGTVHEVVNGLMAHPPESRPALGVVPAGTGNALARDLGLEAGQWREAADIIAGRQARPVDVARVSDADGAFHFINILGAGFVVEAARRAARLKALGSAAYTIGTLVSVLTLGSLHLRVEVDGERLEEDSLFVEVSNSRWTGTRFLMAPGARLDDGLLDLTLVRRVSRRRLLQVFPTIFDGRHVDLDEVTVRQGRHIRLLAPQGLPTTVDGELRGRLPLDIACKPGAIRIFMPPSR
jgi:diacylglycerol kinase (ATP)